MSKKLNRRCLTELNIDFWLRAWNIELTLVPSLQIKPKKYSARKYVWHHFWIGKKSRWDSKHNECLCWSSRPKHSLKKMLWEISQNSQENVCVGISFLVFSCEFWEICKNAFFGKQHRTTASDYSSINIVVKGILANETVNYDTTALLKSVQIVNLRITE